MEGVEQFRRAWDAPDHPDNRTPVEIYRTPVGNLNSTGLLGNYEGPALSRWHPQFQSSLEPGVQQLVQAMVEKLDLVTYTCCEGHRYPGSRFGPVERHVGVLPRNHAEEALVLSTLERVAATARRRAPRRGVVLAPISGVLLDGRHSYPVVDLFFHRKRWSSWAAYFKHLPTHYAAAVNAIAIIAQEEKRAGQKPTEASSRRTVAHRVQPKISRD
jgi:hypothetical protein